LLAACLAVVLLPSLHLRLAADYATGSGELQRIVLEDGAVVHLDENSAVGVRYGDDRRAVDLLQGRAYFEVTRTPERPFVVAAGAVRATVLGTAFSVESSPQAVTIALRHGALDVAVEDGRKGLVRLSPGEQVVVPIGKADAAVATKAIDPGEVAAWRDGRLIVHDASVAEVAAALDRRFWGRIVVADEALAEQRIAGAFDLDRPAEALGAIARTHRAKLVDLGPFLLVLSTD
jgi:transmembrane sensor